MENEFPKTKAYIDALKKQNMVLRDALIRLDEDAEILSMYQIREICAKALGGEKC